MKRPDSIAALRRDGFSFVAAPLMRLLLERGQPLGDWERFAASWNDLGPDPYLASVGRQRRRRHAVFSAAASGPIRRAPHQPHFQSVAYNALQGDIERWFEPMLPEVGDSPVLQRILEFSRDFFGRLAPGVRNWHIELHQFRIEASADAAGEPTPEGVHRDGVDYVLVLLIDRHNIASGTTTIRTADGRRTRQFHADGPAGCGAGGRRAGIPRGDAGDGAGPGVVSAPGRAGADVAGGAWGQVTPRWRRSNPLDHVGDGREQTRCAVLSSAPCFVPAQRKTPDQIDPAFWEKPLAMTYSRMRMHTTIGAAAFHFRVRDGIGWCHSAIVTRERVEGRGSVD